ncbi:alpha/beta fold hydrolase, partial [Streptomyces sp. UNOC14_S4]|uniref:alpha/beta fold hydrolase n=1 Tax=Streptomyces sp. UNOC14_S4 TaxID=2872340 RepID=UPI001E3AD4A3
MTETPVNTLQYRSDGPEDAPVLVLGPALGTTWHMWDRQVPELARHWRVLRFDLPGHGGAPAEPAPTVGELSDRLLATLDGLGVDGFGYAGCSIGGAVGADLALRYPHRLSALALIASSARFGTEDSWRQRGNTVRTSGMDPIAMGAPERWFTPGFAAAQPAIVDWSVQMVSSTDPGCYVAACDALAAFDVRDGLGRIGVPTLVLVGAEDQVAPPADARVLVAGIHDARLAVVPGASHLTPVEQPAAVTDLLVRHFTTSWQSAPSGRTPGRFPGSPAPGPAADAQQPGAASGQGAARVTGAVSGSPFGQEPVAQAPGTAFGQGPGAQDAGAVPGQLSGQVPGRVSGFGPGQPSGGYASATPASGPVPGGAGGAGGAFGPYAPAPQPSADTGGGPAVAAPPAPGPHGAPAPQGMPTPSATGVPAG